MVESVHSAIVLTVIAFMAGIIGWVSLTDYKQLDLRDVLSLRAWQPNTKSVKVAGPAVLGDKVVSSEDHPVKYVEDYPVVHLPQRVRPIFAP